MRRTPIAALAMSAALATPAMAQGMDQRFLSSLAGKGDFFWAKGEQYSGDLAPIRARVTSIEWEDGCNMVVRFGAATNGRAPYQSPVFIRWQSIKTVDIAGNFFILRHNYAGFMPGWRWGLWVPENEKARMRDVMGSMLNNCND